MRNQKQLSIITKKFTFIKKLKLKNHRPKSPSHVQLTEPSLYFFPYLKNKNSTPHPHPL